MPTAAGTTRPRPLRRLILSLLCLGVGSVAFAAQPTGAPASRRAHTDAALERALQRSLPAEGLAIGIVLKRDDLPQYGAARAGPLRARQQRVLDTLPPAFRMTRRYESLSGLSGFADRATLDALAANPEVEFVYLQPKLYFTLAQGVPLIGGATAHTLGYTGSGVNVAIIDSGIDTNHPNLIDDLVAEQCFCDNHPNPNIGCCPNGDDAQSGSGAAEDVVGHGTEVSGVITSSGGIGGVGIAPDAGIVAIRIANATYGPNFSDAEAALDWILTNRITYDIEIVNMSFGDSGEYNDSATCTGTNLAIAAKALHDVGVILFAASGNDGHDDGISQPACIPEVISVGGTYDGAVGSPTWCLDETCTATCQDVGTVTDEFVCHTNSDELLDLLAPDWRTTTSAIGGGVVTVGGTSFASPYAAGQAAVLRQADPSLTPAQMRTLMQSYGPMVTSPDNGLAFRRTDLALALQSLIGVDSDSDGIFDDGDLSGTAGDNYCSGGNTANCDDNCIDDSNADQADADSDASGDVCDICPNDPLDDADLDGVCGDVDVCEGFDDNLDFDADSIPDGCDPDDDGDLLLDVVETNTGVYLSPTDTGSDPFDADSDDDGFPDGFEVLRGSDPNSAASVPILHLPALSPPGGALLVMLLFACAVFTLQRRSAKEMS